MPSESDDIDEPLEDFAYDGRLVMREIAVVEQSEAVSPMIVMMIIIIR